MGNRSSKDEKPDHSATPSTVAPLAAPLAHTEEPTPPLPPAFSSSDLSDTESVLASNPAYLTALLARISPSHSHVPSWRMSYRSDRDGKSFSRFSSKVAERGPILLIVEDDRGAIFGAYSGVPLRNADARHKEFQSSQAAAARAERLGKDAPKPSTSSSSLPRDKLFFGDSSAFLFRLKKAPEEGAAAVAPPAPAADEGAPEAEGTAPAPAAASPSDDVEVFTSAGHDGNFVWFETNIYPEEQRGVGFGGRAELWSLFLDRYFTMGTSCGHPLSLTFKAPMLSSHSPFRISYVEAWSCYGADSDVQEDGGGKKGVLHKLEENPDKKILELQGHRFYSEEA